MITKDDLKSAIKSLNFEKLDKEKMEIFYKFVKDNHNLVYDYSLAFNSINSFLSTNSELTITIQGESYHNTKKIWCTLYLNEDFDPNLIPLINRTIIIYYNKKIADYKHHLLIHFKESKLKDSLGLTIDKILCIFQTLNIDEIERET